MTAVTFIDTSILCELLQVPGKSDSARHAAMVTEMDRAAAGERFVIPVTALIETGNHIAQCNGDRYRLAGKLTAMIRAGIDGVAPWLVLESRLGRDFLHQLCAGDSTGQTLEQLAARKIGSGDVALLVELNQFLSGSAVSSAAVWTLDAGLNEVAT